MSQLHNHLVICLVLISCSWKLLPAHAQGFGLFKRYQLSIYDPMSGRQIDPMVYMRAGRRGPMANGNLIELPQLWNPCACTEFMCKCCIGLRFSENMDNRFCLTMEYNTMDLALQLRIQYNKLTVAQFGFSVRNPPPYCVPILLPLPLSTCIRLYDLQARDGNIQLCLALVLKVFTSQIFEFNFNCMRFGVNGMEFNKPMRDIEQMDDPNRNEDKIQYVRPRQLPLGRMQKLQQQEAAEDQPDSRDNELVPQYRQGSVLS